MLLPERISHSHNYRKSHGNSNPVFNPISLVSFIEVMIGNVKLARSMKIFVDAKKVCA